jgi:hypothetical protein
MLQCQEYGILPRKDTGIEWNKSKREAMWAANINPIRVRLPKLFYLTSRHHMTWIQT